MALKTTANQGNNVAIEGQRGRVGTIRYYVRKGLTYIRSARNTTTSSSNPRSNAQMHNRLQFASLSAIWSLIGDKLAGAFENKEQNQSDQNAFMQINQGLGAYMTKKEYRQGLVVPVAVTIGDGSLAAINLTAGTGQFITNLSVGSATDISSVKKLSDAIVANNTGFEYGDQITLVLGYAKDATNKSCSYKVIVLSADDETAISGVSVSDGKLAFTADMSYNFAGVLHTDENGKSSNAIVCLDADAQSVYAAHSTASAFQTARDSYGKASTSFLRPSSSVEFASEEDAEGPFTISLSASPANGGTVTGAGSYAKNATATIKAEAVSGYHFTQWSDGDTNATRTLTVTADKSLTAIFAQNSEDGE